MRRVDDITKLCLMNFFVHLSFLSPLITFFFNQRGLSYFEILALESVLVVFMVFFEVPTGILADRFGRKLSVVAGTLLLTAEPLIFLFADSFLWFATAFALSGIGITFHSGSIEALIYDRLKSQGRKHEMKRAIGSFWAASLVAMMIAPTIGSFLAQDLAMQNFETLLYLGIGSMCVAIMLSLLVREDWDGSARSEAPLAMFADGVRLLRTNRRLRRIVLLSVCATPFVYGLGYLYQPYLQTAGVDTALFGGIYAVALLAGAVLQKYAYWFEEKLGMRWAVFVSTLLPGVFYLAMSFTYHPLAAVALFMFTRTTMGVQEPLFSDYKNLHIPSGNRSTVLSLISIVLSLYLAIMRLIIGWLADIELSYAFLFMGAVIIAASIFLRIDERHVSVG